MPKSTKIIKYNESDVPGPGYYEYSKKNEGGITMGIRFPEDKGKENYPGPGQYKPQEFSKGPQYTIASKTQALKGRDQSNDVFYSIEDAFNATSQHTGAAKFGTSERKQSKRDNYPGPGYYKHFEDKYDGSVTMGQRLNENKKDNYPGPGNYKSGNYENGPSYTMSRSERQLKASDKANYTFYNVEDAFLATTRKPANTNFGTSERKDLAPSEYPGPGYYSNLNLRKQGGVTMGQRFKDKDLDNYPGPGQYTVYKPDGKPAYTMAPKLNFEKYRDVTDDRFYEIQPAFDFQDINPGKTKIGTSKRSEAKQDNYPGPGYYFQ